MPYFLIYCGCVGFALSFIGIYLPYIQQLDLQIVLWMSQHRSELLTDIAVFLSNIGGLPAMLVILGIVCLQRFYVKKYTHIIFICLGLFGSAAIGWLLKYLFNRARPEQVYPIVETYGASFPSGHSIYAAVLSCLLVYLCHTHHQLKSIQFLACSWLIMMGVSRVYLGAHFPTDVIAGWSIALIWMGLLWLQFSPTILSKNKLFIEKDLKEVKE